ncbi:MAG: diguanylate cyclase, partial [Betaproteobacteria bacterium]
IGSYLAETGSRLLARTMEMVRLAAEGDSPLWVADLANDRRARDSAAACAAGLRSACLIRVMVDGRVSGVFTFLGNQVREPDARLRDAALAVASQVGQFLERRQGEEDLRESEARYRAFTGLSSVFYGEQDEHQRFTRLSGRDGEWRGGIPRDTFLGRTRREVPDVVWDEPQLIALENLIASRQPFRDFEIGRTHGDGEKQYVSLSGEPRFDAAGCYIGSRSVGTNITERRKAAQRLSESETRYRALAEMSSDWYWEQDEHQRLTKLSEHMEADDRLTGWAPLGKTRWELDIRYDPADRVALEADIAARRPFREFKFERVIASGAERHLQISGEPMYDETGRYCGYRGTGHDITELRRRETAMATSRMQQGLSVQFGHMALAVTDVQVLKSNAVAAVVEGLGTEFCSVARFKAGCLSTILDAGEGWEHGWLGQAFTATTPRSHTAFLLEQHAPVVVDDFASDGRFSASPVLSAHRIASALEVLIGGADAPYGVLGGYSRRHRTFTDESVDFVQGIANMLGTAIERSYAEARLAHLAKYDSLTGLANRDLFAERLAQSLATAALDRKLVGVLYIDLNSFKAVNDNRGHDAGDRLLTLVAERLRSCVRKIDTVGRQGGDEFSIMINDLAEASHASKAAGQIAAQLARPFDLDGFQAQITASIGISIYPLDGTTVGELLKRADAAMYQSKEQSHGDLKRYSVRHA